MELLQTVIHHPLTDVMVTVSRHESLSVIKNITVGRKAQNRFVASDNAEEMTEMISMIQEYLNGTPVDFSEVPVDFSAYTTFQTLILKTTRSIPYGETRSYSGLAEMAGCPQSTRAVGSVMRVNRHPLIIPCHRVIRKCGGTGAYCGDAVGEDALLKKRLLDLEKGVMQRL